MKSSKAETTGTASAITAGPTLRAQVFLLGLLVFPLLVNDFANIYLKDNWRWWYFIDLGMVKPFQCVLICWMIAQGYARVQDFGLRKISGGAFVLVTALMTLGGVFVLFNGLVFFYQLIGLAPLGGYPTVMDPWFRWVDLTLGLALVGVLEETIFRGFMGTVLQRMHCSNFRIVLVSSLCFGAVHWSNGLHAVITTTIIGAMFMGFYLKCRSTLPLILAHYLIDFFAFSMLIPMSWFVFVR